MKRIFAFFVAVLLSALPLSGCNTAGNLEGAHVFVFSNSESAFGKLVYEGFQEIMEAKGAKAAFKSPNKTTVAAQVEVLNKLVSYKVASITVSAGGDKGYEEVFAKAKKEGIKIISVDSKVDDKYRVTHVDPVSPPEIGRSLIHAAVLIALKKDYPEDGDLQKASDEALAAYTGEILNFGVLSASNDTPIQNAWISSMEEELQREIYAGKVDPVLDKKYGNDDPNQSAVQAKAFVTENVVEVIIAPTTVGMAAAGKVLKSSESPIKLTGLGLPREMQDYMPNKAGDKAEDFICPFMILWDPIELGRVAAMAAWSAVYDGYNGKVDSGFQIDAMGGYPARSFTTIEHPGDGGTQIIMGKPIVFYKKNLDEWKKKF